MVRNRGEESTSEYYLDPQNATQMIGFIMQNKIYEYEFYSIMSFKEKFYFTYILASKKHGTLYVGVTSDLQSRVYQHKTKVNKGFTAKYNVNRLVYYEEFGDILAAIAREKQLKGWLRIKKIKLIEKDNPNWNDLSEGWYNF